MTEIKLRIEDMYYAVQVPDGYSDIGRLTWKSGRPGIYAKDLKGRDRFIRAYRTNYGKNA